MAARLDRGATLIFRCPTAVRQWLEKKAASDDTSLTMELIRLLRAEMARDERRRKVKQ
jgi:hypothetical protein